MIVNQDFGGEDFEESQALLKRNNDTGGKFLLKVFGILCILSICVVLFYIAHAFGGLDLHKLNEKSMNGIENKYIDDDHDCTIADYCAGYYGCYMDQSWCPITTINCPACN